MATSTYIQISEYLLLEYIYSNETIQTTKAKPYRLYNKYSNEYQFLNSTQAINLTGNVLDYSAVRMGRESTQWGYLDMDTPSPLVQIDSNLKLEDVSALMGATIKYDRVKLHLLSGYDLPGIDGFIMEIGWREWDINGDTGRKFTPAAQVYVKGEERIDFSPIPLFLGDRFYDRYIEFALPSLADANFDFWNSPTAPTTLGYNYTFNNVGFSKTSQIYATLWEINSTSESRGNRFFITGASYSASFNQADLYSYVNAVVQENAEYDYIEYYPTWNGQFLEDYINLLNDSGGDWVVINQLDLYEQLGMNFIKSFSMSSLQDTAFNAPAAYRPIIRNAALAISYTIEYTMRLMNKTNGQEIIRKATWTSTDPKKYGPSLQRINVLEGFRPVKVYNKIVNQTSDTINTSVQYLGSPNFLTQNVYVNTYYDVNYISVDSSTDLSVTLGNVVYPQGTNYIFINKFDNYVKFKVFTKSADKLQNVTMDFASTGMNVKLTFILDDSTKIYIDLTSDLNAANPGARELLFFLDDTLTTKLLGNAEKEYYLVNKNPDGTETLIYRGQYADLKNRSQILSELSATLFNQIGNQANGAGNAAGIGPASTVILGLGNVNSFADPNNANFGGGLDPNNLGFDPAGGGRNNGAGGNGTNGAGGFGTNGVGGNGTNGGAGGNGTNGGAGGNSSGNAALNNSQSAQISQSQSSLSPSSAGAQGVQSAIANAAGNANSSAAGNAGGGGAGGNGSTSNLNIVSIPGVTPGLGANINSSLTPNVVKPSSPKTVLSYAAMALAAFQMLRDLKKKAGL